MEKLLAPDVLGILIQTVGAIIVAFIMRREMNKTNKKSIKNNGVQGKNETAEPPPNESLRYLLGLFMKQWLPIGVVGALTFSLIGFAYNSLTPDPRIRLTSPSTNEPINVKLESGGGGMFSVDGTSERVTSDAEIAVIVLIHPVEPYAEGWWIQSPVTMQPNGGWTVQAFIGSADYPPEEGHLLDIVAVIAERNLKQSGEHVLDLKDMNLTAQSKVYRVKIGSVVRN